MALWDQADLMRLHHQFAQRGQLIRLHQSIQENQDHQEDLMGQNHHDFLLSLSDLWSQAYQVNQWNLLVQETHCRHFDLSDLVDPATQQDLEIQQDQKDPAALVDQYLHGYLESQ